MKNYFALGITPFLALLTYDVVISFLIVTSLPKVSKLGVERQEQPMKTEGQNEVWLICEALDVCHLHMSVLKILIHRR